MLTGGGKDEWVNNMLEKFSTRGFPEGSKTLSIEGSHSTLLSEPTITPGRSLKLAPYEKQNRSKHLEQLQPYLKKTSFSMSKN